MLEIAVSISSKSLVRALILFILYLNDSLRLYIDYYRLNNRVLIKN